MSIDINWSSLDHSIGSAIRTTLNSRLRNTELPSFLRNIEILSFSLGSEAPEIAIKDITDPFPEFYEDESSADLSAGAEDESQTSHTAGRDASASSPEHRRRSLSGLNSGNADHRAMNLDDLETTSTSSGPPPYAEHTNHQAPSSTTSEPQASETQAAHVAIWEGMNLPYFHSTFAAANTGGIFSASGISTPRPAFMGLSTTFHGVDETGIRDRRESLEAAQRRRCRRRRSSHTQTMSESDGTGGRTGPCTGTSTGTGTGRRTSTTHDSTPMPNAQYHHHHPNHHNHHDNNINKSAMKDSLHSTDTPEVAPEHVQLEVQVDYAGSMSLSLRAELALNYPSPHFVSLPIEMAMSGFKVSTLAVVAYIEGAVHVSLLQGPQNPVQAFRIESQIGAVDHRGEGNISGHVDGEGNSNGNGNGNGDGNGDGNGNGNGNVNGDGRSKDDDNATINNKASALVDLEKIEGFMLLEVQKMVEKEIVFPSYYTFIL